ncbi:MAG: ABC transporter ATP-binding protein [Nitrospiraceae bacterium]
MTDGISQALAYSAAQLVFRYSRAQAGREEGPQRWTLDRLSFDVREGEVFGMIGPNGSGKTSLLKLLAKVLRPQDGALQLFGQSLDRMPQHAVARLVAMVPQETQQVFPYTILETVLMGRFPHHRDAGWGVFGWESEEDLRLAQEAMKELDVTHLASCSIHEVSGGERQRAVIARALTQQPRVLLLDEPTAFLDLNHQVEICRILRRLNQERGLTVILVSHDLNLAAQYCDRLMLIQDGRSFLIGSPDDVIRPDVLKEIYGCEVLVDRHPISGLPRVTLPGRSRAQERTRQLGMSL